MREPGLARRYARAFCAAAREIDAVDAVDADLKSVAGLLGAQKGLKNFLHSPKVRPDAKRDMLESVLGGRVKPLTSSFLRLLLDKKRFDLIEEIADEVSVLADIDRGIVRAVVTTPVPLPETQEVRLSEVLAARTGKTVKIECEVDPSMIGGISVVVGNQLLDGSVQNALSDMRDELRALSVI